jgi:hypothetical protein
MTKRYSKSQGQGQAWEGLGCILAPESDDDAGSTGLASPLEAGDIYFNSTEVQTFIVEVRRSLCNSIAELTLPVHFARTGLQAHTSPGLAVYR